MKNVFVKLRIMSIRTIHKFKRLNAKVEKWCLAHPFFDKLAKKVGILELVFFGWVFFGGIDCEPPKDDDSLIPETTNSVPPCANAFVAMTNLAHKVADAAEKSDLLSFYVDPVANAEYFDPRWNDDCHEAVSKDVMDGQRMADAIEAALASNKMLLAIYDHALTCEAFLPPPIKEYNFLLDTCRGLTDLNFTDLIKFSRTVLPARIKLAAQKGDFAKAVSLFEKDVAFARRMSENPGWFYEYLVAEVMSRNAVAGMARAVREYDFPDAGLQKVDDIIVSASHDNKSHFIHAMKREYMVLRSRVTWLKSSDALGKSDNFIGRALAQLGTRYAFQPNKTLSRLVDVMRSEIAVVSADKVPSQECRECRTCSKTPWYSTMLPNWLGEEIMCSGYGGYADKCVRQITLQLLVARIQVAMIRYSRKHGREAESMEELAEFLGDYPRTLLGEPVEICLKERKMECGGHSMDIETERIRCFPFIKKDGRIMTNDGKTVMALENVEEFSTDELDSHADSVDYNGIKTLIVGNNYTNESERGRGIFRLCPSLLTESYSLHEVVVPSNHPTYAVSDGVVYLKEYGCMIRCLAGRESVVVPTCIKEVTPRAFLHSADLKFVVFNGPLPRIYTQYDGVAGELSRRWDRFLYWCRHRRKNSWKRIFESHKRKPLLSRTAKDCVTIVMGENLDSRTRAFLKKGEWEGRRIMTRAHAETNSPQ